MNAFNLAKTRALGPVALGIVASALSLACSSGTGGGTEPNRGEPTGSSKAAEITPLSLTTGGCNAVGTFGITSPQVIGFIAANTSNFQNAQLQLFKTNGQNQLMQLKVTAQQASAQMQALLTSASASSASQDAHLAQTSSNKSRNTATTNVTAMEQDQTTVTGSQSQFAKNDSTAFHSSEQSASANGSSSHGASSSNSASQNASGVNAASNAANQNFVTAAFQSSLVPAFFGGVALFPSFSAQTANGSNSVTANGNAFFANANTAAGQNAASQSSAFDDATHADNQSLDHSDTSSASGSNFAQTISHSTNASSGTSASNSASNAASSSADQSSRANQTASNANLQQNSSTSSSHTQVLDDLQQFDSSSYVLVVNMTASQANNVLQLFQGSNGVVTGNQTFPIRIPTCGVATSPAITTGTPVITPVSLAGAASIN